MAHFHPALGPGGFRHVCMIEGPDPELRLSTLQHDTLLSESERNAKEVERLKALLHQHHIKYDTSLPVSKNCATEDSDDNRPRLPPEILLRILGFALASPVPIIDPFYKLRIQNVTKVERRSRRYINVQCLGVSQACKMEGMRILLERNQFVFTQAAAVEHFGKVPQQLRSTIKHVTFRVVGRYYNDEAGKTDVSGNGFYHDSIPKFIVPVLPRPQGMINDNGMQAYCWFQVADFLRAMQLAPDSTSNDRPKLFPSLETMRLDLVNFCDHLPLGTSNFAAVVRWHLGRMLDELLVTGLPEEDASADEQMVLRNLLKHEGLFSSAGAAFVSIKEGVKSLPVYGYSHELVFLKMNKKNSKKNSKKKSPSVPHPEGGQPPESTRRGRKTVWKWAKEHEDEPKQWIEFDGTSGIRMSEIEEEDENDDEDQASFAALLGLPLFPMFGTPPPGNAMPAPNDEVSDGDENLDDMPELVDIDG